MHRILLLSFLLLWQLSLAFAQCPLANSCTPGTALPSNHIFGMGIYNVSVGSGTTGFTNVTTGGSTDGYQDYSCTKKASVQEGVATSIYIATNVNANENVKVWIDLNNNGAFDATSELVFTSTNAKVHTGMFTIPAGASVVKNTVLRMRVSADNFSLPPTTPCSTPAYSQVEDYGLIVLSFNQKPVVNFSVPNPTVCAPTVQFQNLTQNSANTYLWSFGDNTTSTQANPTHTYAGFGNYTIKLKACNANGCDSLTKTNYISYQSNGPIAAVCAPSTTGYCCGYGITKVTLHSLTNTSQNAAAGYEDFTCTKSVTVVEGKTYSLEVETGGTNNHDTWAYIDYNNNGTFETSEKVFEKLNSKNPIDSISISAFSVKNIPLRLRIISDNTGSSNGSCVNRTMGQAEDYSLIITPNNRLPTPAFNSSFTTSCDTLVQFTDASVNAITSWKWDFGDGTPISTLQNPQHSYRNTGVYHVKLKVCNAIACDSIIKSNYITIRKPCLTYCQPPNNSGLWLTNVTFNTINNSTGAAPNSYGQYLNKSTTVVAGNSYTLAASINASGLGHRTTVYIDYNQDGDFYDQGELVITKTGFFDFSENIKINSNAKPGLTRLRVIIGNDFIVPLPCISNWYLTEMEDYSILIQPANQKPVANFVTAKTSNTCNFTIAFADTSSNSPTSWSWDFGDPGSNGNFSSAQNPSHTFSGPGLYPVKLVVCNSFGCDTLIKPSYTFINSNSGPKPAACFSPTINTFNHFNYVISNVTLNSINKSSLLDAGYQDYSCSQQTTLLRNVPYNLTVKNKMFMDVKAWLDFNNDGVFDELTETVFNSSKVDTLHTVSILAPANVVLNQPLRLRISNEIGVLDKQAQTPFTPCDPLHLGQSEDYSVTFVNSLGILDLKLLSNQIKVYPNPNSGRFSLEVPSGFTGNHQLVVQDMVGKTVAEMPLKVQNSNSYQLDLSYIPKGMYLLKLSNEGSTAVKKIVIE